MFDEYNRRLDELRAQMARKAKLDAVLKDLDAQKAELEKRADELKSILAIEQEDVDRLMGGFRSIYYAIIGKKEEMLEKEQAEVLKASMQYEAARSELENIQKEIDAVARERNDVWDCEVQYRLVLEEKLKKMREGGPTALKIAEIEEKQAYLGVQLCEIDEAMAMGKRALGQIDAIAKSLDSAENWGTWDMFGGGTISHLVKHSHLDDAQDGVSRLESTLRRFRTELADVTIQSDIRVQVDGFLRFADWFFDGLFVDWTVLSQIQESQSNLKQTERQVRQVMEQLARMKKEIARAQDRLSGELRAIAENT